MKKIMFNDALGLTESVLKKRKTRTMRMLSIPYPSNCSDLETDINRENIKSRYNVGEIVSIAQSYNIIKDEIEKDPYNPIYEKYMRYAAGKDLPGNTNKMFVRCDLMPHHIRIMDIHISRLHDITDEECMQEGIREFTKDGLVTKYGSYDGAWEDMERTPRDAFRVLIDTICGKGTWEKNPWMQIYKFELVD